MSLFDCIGRAMREGLMDKERGRRAGRERPEGDV